MRSIVPIWMCIGLFAFFSTCYYANGAIERPGVSNKIDSLPGFDGRLRSDLYHGIMDIPGGKHISYMFVESIRSPSQDPLILWMQGGPGASGFIGMFTEVGPFSLSGLSLTDPSNVPKVFTNQFSWTLFSNMIFFESPVGTGYSYCDSECPVNNDTSAADDAYEFLKAFFETYPNFRRNALFLAGESYGGIYIPMLAEKIIDNLDTYSMSFKGVMVGNGCTGLMSTGGCGPHDEIDDALMFHGSLHYPICSIHYGFRSLLMHFLHGHGQIPSVLYKDWEEHCLLVSEENDVYCEALYNKAMAAAGTFNEYSLYDECYSTDGIKGDISPSLHSYQCKQEVALTAWITHPEVKKMLGVSGDWNMHDGNWDLYHSTKDDVVPIYKKLGERNYSVLIYYGDTDTAVSYLGGERWLFTEDNFLQTSKWVPWDMDELAVAGYMMKFEPNVMFVTFRGAGHMVPREKPYNAFQFFHKYMNSHSN